MIDQRKISISIPTWQRFEMVIESFAAVLHDERVSEIILVDDFSQDGSYERLQQYFANEPKVKLYRNNSNMDCYRNKREVVSKSSNEWLILLDSDNIIGPDYIDTLFGLKEWHLDTAYMPCFAMPMFDYRAFEYMVFTKENIAGNIDKPMAATCLNCMNYFVSRDKYLSVWDGSVNPHTADSIYQNYNWLNACNRIFVVAQLYYQHRVHAGSHYQNNQHLTGNFYQETIDKIKSLR